MKKLSLASFNRFKRFDTWVKWFIKIQKVISTIFAIVMVPLTVIWAIIILIKEQPFQHVSTAIAAVLALIILLCLISIFIKNIRRPNTFTLLFECLMVSLFCTIAVYSAFLGRSIARLYVDQEDAYVKFTEHALRMQAEFNRAMISDGQITLTPVVTSDLSTGLALASQPILFIIIFYLLQILVQQRKKKLED